MAINSSDSVLLFHGFSDQTVSDWFLRQIIDGCTDLTILRENSKKRFRYDIFQGYIFSLNSKEETNFYLDTYNLFYKNFRPYLIFKIHNNHLTEIIESRGIDPSILQ